MPRLLHSMILIAALASGSAGVSWHDRIELASGEAHQGPWRMNRSDFRWVDDPTVAVDEAGVISVAWVDQSRKDVFLQSYSPDGKKLLERPVNVSRTPEVFSWLPRLALNPRAPDEVYVLWQEIVFSGGTHGGEIFFARSTDRGKTFLAPVNLSNSIAGDGKGRLTRRYWHNGSLDLAAGPKRTLYAAWTEYEGTLWLSRSSDGGKKFSKPLRITDPGSVPARGPSLAVAGDDVYLAWAVGEDPAADIRIATSGDAGRSFGPPRAVLESDGHADAPKIVVDGEGTVHLAYAESPTGPLERYQVRTSRSRDRARTFTEPKTIANDASFPALGVDGKNNLVLLFDLFPERRERARGLGLAISSDAGRTFAPPIVVPGSADPALGHNGSRQGMLMRKLAVTPAGAIAVVNSTFREGKRSHVWLFRGSPLPRDGR